MRKLLMVVALAALLGGAAYTAEKNYQFTGTVKTVTGNTFTVEKSAKEVWTF